MISALLVLAASTPEVPAAPALEVRPCAAPAPRAQCGIVRVPENRAAPLGRQIDLNIVVLTSEERPRLPPLFDLEGGPGLPSSKNIGFYATNGISKGREVVMIDQRGTGRSNPLLCPELQTGPTVPMFPPAAVERCRATLAKTADLRFYGTRDAVRDLDDVRRALGYGQIDLFGLSYGSTVALRYMARYPDKVRAAILMGVAPPDLMPPRDHATAADRALKLVISGCAADANCRQGSDLATALAQARARAGQPGAPASAELLMERLRSTMYTPASRAGLPAIIRRAANGDVAALFAKSSENAASAIADGMFLAVTCGESFPLMNYRQAAAAARRTPFGDYRLRRQKAACAGWPQVVRDPDPLALPVRSTAAVLLISGELDPVTPPEQAERVAAKLRRARHLVIPGGGHVPDGLIGLETCLDPVMIAFLDHGDPQQLDAACVRTMSGPPYAAR